MSQLWAGDCHFAAPSIGSAWTATEEAMLQLARAPAQLSRAARVTGAVALGLFLAAVAVVGLLVLAAQATRS